MPNTIIASPAGYTVSNAVAFADSNGRAQLVQASAPLPVSVGNFPNRLVTTSSLDVAATTTPLTGSASASATVGPFSPQLSLPIWLTVWGSWVGSVQVLRSHDGGTTRLPLTLAGTTWALYTGNCNEQLLNATDAAAVYYLQITLNSGSVNYRLSQ
ncbi:MAG TPA: hypothetical protein VN222_09680 [Novosphingobium sp.]|nr:hypothetical protein [Novosphingobium sp.]